MTDFITKKLPYDLSPTAGLALVGKYPHLFNKQPYDRRGCDCKPRLLRTRPKAFAKQMGSDH